MRELKVTLELRSTVQVGVLAEDGGVRVYFEFDPSFLELATRLGLSARAATAMLEEVLEAASCGRRAR